MGKSVVLLALLTLCAGEAAARNAPRAQRPGAPARSLCPQCSVDGKPSRPKPLRHRLHQLKSRTTPYAEVYHRAFAAGTTGSMSWLFFEQAGHSAWPYAPLAGAALLATAVRGGRAVASYRAIRREGREGREGREARAPQAPSSAD